MNDVEAAEGRRAIKAARDEGHNAVIHELSKDPRVSVNVKIVEVMEEFMSDEE